MIRVNLIDGRGPLLDRVHALLRERAMFANNVVMAVRSWRAVGVLNDLRARGEVGFYRVQPCSWLPAWEDPLVVMMGDVVDPDWTKVDADLEPVKSSLGRVKIAPDRGSDEQRPS